MFWRRKNSNRPAPPPPQSTDDDIDQLLSELGTPAVSVKITPRNKAEEEEMRALLARLDAPRRPDDEPGDRG